MRSRADWSFDVLREEFSRAICKQKPTRFVFPMNVGSGRVGVKVLVFDEFNVRLRSLYGRCRTRKEWENHLAAFNSGIPTVSPVALAELRKPILVHEAVIITEWRDNTVSVANWRSERADDVGDSAALEIAASIGRLTAMAQEHGLYHNEIRPGNLLIETADKGPQLLLIDWKHARIKPRTTENDLQNLVRTAQLFDFDASYATPTDSEKSSFMTAYLEASSDRPDRAELLAKLRKSCPNASWVPS